MADKEQRHSQRKAVVLNASVSHIDSFGVSKPIAVKTLNLSKTGTLIESPEKLYPGELCSFNIVTHDAKNVFLQGRIIWVNPEADGKYRAGVSFRNLSADEEYLISLTLVRSG